MKLILDDLAKWRPLGDVMTEPSIGRPRVLIWHTMVGFLMSTEGMFKKNGFRGTESTFGLGGRWDGPELDGVLFQWQRLDRQADANWDANAFGNSVECSDGGNPDNPFTVKQVETSIKLGVLWCQETGNPAIEAQTPTGQGFGYHSLFLEWNKTRHTCPNPNRISQLRKEIWPEIATQLRGGGVVPKPRPAPSSVENSVAPKFPLRASWYFGRGGVMRSQGLRIWQKQMRNRGWRITADGIYGPETNEVATSFQREKKLKVDGDIGIQTWNAAWTAKIT
jgi:hypothetical protein